MPNISSTYELILTLGTPGTLSNYGTIMMRSPGADVTPAENEYVPVAIAGLRFDVAI